MRNYRGLTKDGKWVYGYHLAVGPENNTSHYILPHENAIWTSKTFSLNKDEDFITGFIEVIPETVGQQVGLKDKNGKGIYHHDIVKDKNGYKWEIMWGNAQFYLLSIEKDLLPDRYKFPGYCKIIGNVHQNKELMEQGQ